MLHYMTHWSENVSPLTMEQIETVFFFQRHKCAQKNEQT